MRPAQLQDRFSAGFREHLRSKRITRSISRLSSGSSAIAGEHFPSVSKPMPATISAFIKDQEIMLIPGRVGCLLRHNFLRAAAVENRHDGSRQAGSRAQI